VPAAGMGVLFLLAWLISKKGKGKDVMFTLFKKNSCNDRQMNVDYSICNAMKYRTDSLLEYFGIYDIACQWWIHFLNDSGTHATSLFHNMRSS
jgi:hypothetical protein